MLDLFVLLFLVTPCLVLASQPCVEWIPIKKKDKILLNIKCFTSKDNRACLWKKTRLWLLNLKCEYLRTYFCTFEKFYSFFFYKKHLDEYIWTKKASHQFQLSRHIRNFETSLFRSPFKKRIHVFTKIYFFSGYFSVKTLKVDNIKVFLLLWGWTVSVSPFFPFFWGGWDNNLVPHFEKGVSEKKECLGDIKGSCHKYLPSGLTVSFS